MYTNMTTFVLLMFLVALLLIVFVVRLPNLCSLLQRTSLLYYGGSTFPVELVHYVIANFGDLWNHLKLYHPVFGLNRLSVVLFVITVILWEELAPNSGPPRVPILAHLTLSFCESNCNYVVLSIYDLVNNCLRLWLPILRNQWATFQKKDELQTFVARDLVVARGSL